MGYIPQHTCKKVLDENGGEKSLDLGQILDVPLDSYLDFKKVKPTIDSVTDIKSTDLPGGNLEQMRSTLRGIIEAFPDETVLLPGHGEPTTVGAEKLHNPYLQADFLKD